jgi:hypothetical protein
MRIVARSPDDTRSGRLGVPWFGVDPCLGPNGGIVALLWAAWRRHRIYPPAGLMILVSPLPTLVLVWQR